MRILTKGNKMKIKKIMSLNEDGVGTGAMSPMLDAKEIAKQMNIRLKGISSVWWSNERFMQYKDEDSGMSTLILLETYKDTNVLYMFTGIDLGMMPVAYYETKSKDLNISELYRNDIRLIHPKDSEILEVFETIANDMDLIIPSQKSIKEV